MFFYALIFVAKLIEVSVTTVRVVLTARGNRLVASLLAAVEITLWIIVASTVLLGIAEDPLRAVAYGLAYVFGIFFGIVIEDKLALGLSEIEIIAAFEVAKQITEKLREHDFGVTTFDCEGRSGKKLAISLKVRRKDVKALIAYLKEYGDLFVTVTDIRKLSIGNIKKHVIK